MNNSSLEIQDTFRGDSNFLSIIKKIENNSNSLLNISGLDKYLIDYFPSFLNTFFDNFSFLYSYKEQNFDSFLLKNDTTRSDLITILESLDFYTKVDIINDNYEYSVLGDKVDICLNKIIYRFIFFGNILESISVRDFLTFKNILFLDKLYLPKNKDVFFSSYEKELSKTHIYFNLGIDGDINLDYNYFSDYHISFNTLFKSIEANVDTFIIFTSRGIFESNLLNGKKVIYSNIEFPRGFFSANGRFAVFTDVELYGEFNLNQYRKKKSKRIVTDFTDGKIYEGDYIVHINHGIGIFRGIKSKNIKGINKDFIEIEYSNNDKLYLPLEISDRITKYISDTNKPPKLTKLGTREWENVKSKIKKEIQNIAKDIILVHAQRISVKKVLDNNINYELEEEFNNQFEHIETSDQLEAIKDVRNDLLSEKVMDRLIVGDVGFGKTEVAVRAAFISVMMNKQVLFVAPTTILVEQHYKVFKKRFKNFPVKIAYLNRNITKKEEKAIFAEVERGSLDILIATHKAFSNNLKFKKLGLVIVDEEQRFGVKQKEKLKKIKADIDYLSMTATPIPRTLYSSFTGIKDISIIASPPLGRKPIYTEIIDFDVDRMNNIIMREIKRLGQVFFLHNNISTLYNIKTLLIEKIPNIRIEIAYGSLPGLDKLLYKFKNKEFDVLLSTSIIENGIDFPNVNTIIINQAFRFGLGQLYQIRGRVGRSDRDAYCYLVCPPSIINNNGVVKDRLETLVKNQNVGSGFTISLKDLEIRGAGEILGVNQHGNVSRIGFDLYSQLLQKAIDDINIFSNK